MADLETSLRTLTLQGSGISTAFGARFFWDHIPEEITTYPIVRAQTITDPLARTHSGTYGGRANVQLDVFDDDKAGCNTSADLLIAWLDNYRGGLGAHHVTIQIKSIMGGWEAESRLFRRILQAEILYMKQV
jgi:hypothetical protein